MYLEHFQLTHPPFAESSDLSLFFPESRIVKICQFLIPDILAGKRLLKLVGKEGSGKTLLCRMIEERLPDACRVVTMENPVGSFDDLLRIVCIELGMEAKSSHDEIEVFSELQRLLAQAHDQGLRVVLIIDEAEKLFLAALERLVRHVGENAGDLRLTLVLVGRPALDANHKQMASFSTKAAFSNTYILEDFSESEIRQYLRFRAGAAGMSEEHFAEVFTEAVVTKIFNAAKGNLRLINVLAEEALQDFCAEKSFMVLLDHVEPEAVVEPVRRQSRLLLLYELLRGKAMLTGALIGSIILVLAIGLFLNRTGEQSSSTSIKGGAALPTSQLPSSTPTFTAPHPLPQQAQVDGEKIFRERLGASANWLAGMYQGKYTIQLMMLASPSAQFSLAGTLATDDYAPILDQVYIRQKQTNPPTLFVFYGIYDSLDAAREARNSMPVFLRKNQPYPLSISEALRKIEH